MPGSAAQPKEPGEALLSPAGDRPTRNPQRLAWKWRLLLLLGVLLLISAAGWFALVRPLIEPAPLPLPARLAGLSLTRHAFGTQAASEIAHLHGRGFPLTGAAMAEYGDGASTLWVARTWGKWGAERLVRSMTAAIEDGTSPFTPTGWRMVGGRTVYTLDGMGMTHVYFQAGDWVIWLAASPEQADQALADLLAFTARK